MVEGIHREFEVAGKFAIEDADVFIGKENQSSLLQIADLTEAAHSGLEDKHFGLGLAV